MTGLRQDWLRGWWTRVAPRRGERPVDAELQGDGAAASRGAGDAASSSAEAADASADAAPPVTGAAPSPAEAAPPPAQATSSSAPGCPFCPGAEDDLAGILQELPGPGGGWTARAVVNRYPFLAAGEGVQEVLVESPRHARAFRELPAADFRAALTLYRDRLRHHHRAHPGWEVHLFRNQGREAGTSRAHPHAQLVALPGPTPGREGMERRLREAAARTGGCALCAELATPEHLPGGARHVLDTPAFRGWTLHAPLDPAHFRLVPRRHGPSFAAATDGEVGELAALLPELLAAVEEVAGSAAWNLLVHDHGPADHPALHWHLELRPRVGRTAGFEQMTETGVCPSEPEADAHALRQRLASSRR